MVTHFMSKKIFLMSLIIGVLFCTNIFSQKNRTKIFGNWESVKSKSNYVDMLQLLPNGTYISESVAASDYTYKIFGDTLITSLKVFEKDTVIIDTSTIEVRNDTLINTYRAGGKEMTTKMVRMNGEKILNKNIAGDYVWRYPNGHLALSRFTKNGELLFRLPRLLTRGKFSIKGNTIVFHNPYLKDEAKNFWLKGNLLIVTNPKTKEQSMYHRVEYFIE